MPIFLQASDHSFSTVKKTVTLSWFPFFRREQKLADKQEVLETCVE